MRSRDSIIIIGEQADHDGADPLSGDSGRRMARLIGVDFREFLESFVRINLWQPAEKPRGEGRRGDLELRVLGGRKVVLLGRSVARAFDLKTEPWLCRRFIQARGSYRPYEVLLLPHPSGRNRWYNDSANREAAGRALREFVSGRR